MDGAARYQVVDDPVELPDGGETIAVCARCGVGISPRDARQRYCTARCRAADGELRPTRVAAQSRRSARAYARDHSYRMARRALRLAGLPLDGPELAALRGAGHVEDWRARVGLPPVKPRGRAAAGDPVKPRPKRAAYRRWSAPALKAPREVAAWGLALSFAPRLVLRPSTRRHLHGLVSRLVGAEHTQVARWALVPTSPAGWGVVFFREADAERLRGVVVPTTIGGQAVEVTLGPALTRVRVPSIERGRHVVAVDAVTPVVHQIAGRTRPVTQPTIDTIERCCGDIAQRLGLHAGRLVVGEVTTSTQPDRSDLGGHVGPIVGWVGRVVVRCNAPVAMLLSLAASVGLGGRVAYGFGRVRVTVTREGA